jgi:hypothetical protein
MYLKWDRPKSVLFNVLCQNKTRRIIYSQIPYKLGRFDLLESFKGVSSLPLMMITVLELKKKVSFVDHWINSVFR